jgi:hypothetical protein
MSVPGQREAPRNEKNHGYFDFKRQNLRPRIELFHKFISVVCCRLLNTPDPRYLENYDRIVAFVPALRRASFRGVTGLLHHSTTIELFSPFKHIEGIDPSLRLPLRCLEAVISNLSHVA